MRSGVFLLTISKGSLKAFRDWVEAGNKKSMAAGPVGLYLTAEYKGLGGETYLLRMSHVLGFNAQFALYVILLVAFHRQKGIKVRYADPRVLADHIFG